LKLLRKVEFTIWSLLSGFVLYINQTRVP